jgi:hypothetical protein
MTAFITSNIAMSKFDSFLDLWSLLMEQYCKRHSDCGFNYGYPLLRLLHRILLGERMEVLAEGRYKAYLEVLLCMHLSNSYINARLSLFHS